MSGTNGAPEDGLESEGNGRDHLGRFTEGNPGGPGRPPGSVDVLAVMRRRCKEEGLDLEEMVWKVMKAQATLGEQTKRSEPASAKLFLDRTCGPVKQESDITSGGKPIGQGPTPPVGHDRLKWLEKSLEIERRRNGSTSGDG